MGQCKTKRFKVQKTLEEKIDAAYFCDNTNV